MTDWFLQNQDALQSFMDAGGPVLWVVGVLATAMAFLIMERYWFFLLDYRQLQDQALQAWGQYQGHYRAAAIRRALISTCRLRLQQHLGLLKTLVLLCPLLGLLGTVTGMIQVFDVVAATGTGNARAMASGISRATIPTMAGLVIALPGLYFSLQLEQLGKRKVQGLADRMPLQGHIK